MSPDVDPASTGTPTSAMPARTSSRIWREPGSSALSPQTARSGGSVLQLLVQLEVQPRDRDVPVLSRALPNRRSEVDLDRSDVDRSPGGHGERDDHRCEDDGQGERRPTAARRASPRSDVAASASSGRREHDDERDPEDARDHGDANGDRVRHLRHAERAPREPTERPEPTEPIDRRPRGGRAEGGEQWPAGSADEREDRRRTTRSTSAVSSVSAPQASEPKSMIQDSVMPNAASP